MNSKIGLMGGVLALQLVVVAIFWLGGGASESEDQFLLQVDGSAVTTIAITESGATDNPSSVRLERGDDGWIAAGIAADDTKISNLLDKIVALRAPWPIATSGSSASRFEVAEDNYQRHVELLDGDDDVLAEFFLGTSPGYQRVHARVADSSDIFSVELSNFELSANLDSWMDKSLLASPEAPSRIHVVMPGSKDQANADRPEPGASDPDTIVTEPRFMPLDAVLERNDEGWAINGNPADQDAAQSYANRFDTLRVLGAADDADAVEHVATVDLTDSEGDLQLTFARKDDDANDYVVKSSRVDGAYRVAAYIAEQIMMTDSDFLPKPEIEEEESQSVSSETQSTP